MLNDAQVTVTGYIATVPKERHLPSGVLSLTMRVGWTPRRLDRSTGEWVDGSTSYATVICWRRLAAHAIVCLRKGDPVNVVGRLSVREYEVDGVRRTSVEIDASSIGHDLNRGVASFSRVRPPTGQTAAEAEAAAKAGQAGQRPREEAGEPGTAADLVPGRPLADDLAAALEDPEGDDLADFAERRLADEGPADEGTADDGTGEEDGLRLAPDQVPVPF